MFLNEFLGSPEAVSRISQALLSDKPSHAYLIEGPEGAGKRTLADIFAAGLLCRGLSVPGKARRIPCGNCPDCEKSQKGLHPDLTVVTGTGATGAINVEAVRSLRAEAAVRPNEASRRVVILEDAHKMTIQAQNAFLKLLEEPPPHCVFLLLCESRRRLLPTIRSRVIALTLTPLPAQDCAALIRRLNKSCPPERALLASRLADGRPGRALALAKGSRLDAVSGFCEGFFQSLASRDEYGFMLYARELGASRDAFHEHASILEAYARDLLLVKSGLPDDCLFFGGSREALSRAAGALTKNGTAAIIKHIEKTRGSVEGNAGVQLAATRLLLRCWEETA